MAYGQIFFRIAFMSINNTTVSDHKENREWLRISFAVALLMMCIAHTVSDAEYVRRVVFSVYVALMFFTFGADYEIRKLSRSRAEDGAKPSLRERTKMLGLDLLSDLKNFVLPVFVVGISPYLIDTAKYPPSAELFLNRVGMFFDAWFWSLGTPHEEHGAIGVLWFVMALFMIRVFFRLLDFLTAKVPEPVRTIVYVIVSVIFCVVTIALSIPEIYTPLALHNALAGGFFYCIGMLYIHWNEFFFRFKYLFFSGCLISWLFGIITDQKIDFSSGGFKKPLVFLVALGGIGVIVFLIRLLEYCPPAVGRVLGFSGSFPIILICAHFFDGFYSVWWYMGEWGLNTALRFITLSLLAWSIGCVLISMGVSDGGYLGETATLPIGKSTLRKIGDIVFYVFFAICYARVFINGTTAYVLINDWTWVNRPYEIAVFGITIMALLTISHARNMKIQLLWIAMVLIGFAHWQRSGEMELFALCIMIVAIAGRSFKPVLWISLIIGSSIMLIAYWASVHGFLPYLVYQTGGLYGSHSFGMVYRTDLAAHVMYLIMTLALLRKEKISSIGYLSLVFSTWIVWRYTHARANTFCIVVFLMGFTIWLLAYLIVKKNIRIPKWTMWIHAFCNVSILAAVFALGGKSKGAAGSDLSTFWARLSLSLQAFRDYPVRLLGTYVPERGAGGTPDPSIPYFYLDITYVRNIIVYGILFAIVYLAIVTWISYRALKEEQTILALGLIIVAVVSMIEHHAADFAYNVLLLAAFAKLSPHRNK